MNNTAPAIRNSNYWIFELREDGTVLYSSPHTSLAADFANNLVGRNFFEDVAGFENISEFRRSFRNFIAGRKAAESLPIRCAIGNEVLQARATLTRAYETGYLEDPSGIVMLEIRENS